MKKVFSFCVLVITILLVNLLTGFITDYFLKYRGITNPLKFTAIGMLFLVIILVPAFKFLDDLVNTFTRKVLTKGNSMFGRVLGTLLMFGLMFFVLFCIYAYQWYGIHVLKIIWNQWM